MRSIAAGRHGRAVYKYQHLLDSASFGQRNLTGDLVERLGHDIVGGRLKQEVILPKEDDLAQRCGVSRTVVRDAMRMLAAKGLIETRTKRGTIVRNRREWSLLDPDVLRWTIASGSRPALLDDMIELRRIVEPAAAQLAAERATRADLACIRRTCEQMASSVLAEDDFLAADIAFHQSVLRAAHNEGLASLSQAIKVALLAAFRRSMEIPDATRTALPLHEAVCEAIHRRDAQSAAASMMKCVSQDTVEIRRTRRR